MVRETEPKKNPEKAGGRMSIAHNTFSQVIEGFRNAGASDKEIEEAFSLDDPPDDLTQESSQ